jgi:hypothetical protein
MSREQLTNKGDSERTKKKENVYRIISGSRDKRVDVISGPRWNRMRQRRG